MFRIRDECKIQNIGTVACKIVLEIIKWRRVEINVSEKRELKKKLII